MDEERRRFESLRPETFRRVRNLDDGHEIDLDRAVERHADKRSGAALQARVYTRRDRVERDVAVAVALVLDVSGSTGELVDEETSATRRVIDVVKEATVLFVEALDAAGDAYGVYAFSGYGRSNVEVLVVKALDAPLDAGVRSRVGGMEPRRSTRMGAAIRHVTARLRDHPSRTKVLLLVSDGRPQDNGYGRTRTDSEYAIRDTHAALLEAKRSGVVPFLVTVERDGADELRAVCAGIGYEVVTDVESLPSRLASLYGALAGVH